MPSPHLLLCSSSSPTQRLSPSPRRLLILGLVSLQDDAKPEPRRSRLPSQLQERVKSAPFFQLQDGGHPTRRLPLKDGAKSRPLPHTRRGQATPSLCQKGIEGVAVSPKPTSGSISDLLESTLSSEQHPLLFVVTTVLFLKCWNRSS